MDSQSQLKEIRLDGEVAYDGKFLKVSRDRIQLPDGKITHREYIRHPGAVCILPLFDDGRVLLERQFRYPNDKVFIEFPAGISQGEMPPLFVTGAAGDAELVNYRVQGRYIVVDRLFAAAELRLGDRRSEQRVRIVRDDGRERRP